MTFSSFVGLVVFLLVVAGVVWYMRKRRNEAATPPAGRPAPAPTPIPRPDNGNDKVDNDDHHRDDQDDDRHRR